MCWQCTVLTQHEALIQTMQRIADPFDQLSFTEPALMQNFVFLALKPYLICYDTC